MPSAPDSAIFSPANPNESTTSSISAFVITCGTLWPRGVVTAEGAQGARPPIAPPWVPGCHGCTTKRAP